MDTGTVLGTSEAPVTIGQPCITQGTDGFDNWELGRCRHRHRSRQVRSGHDRHDPVLQPHRLPRRRSRRWGYAPVLPQTANGEKFVDYSDFSYTRSEVFQGCTTWLDVPR